MQHTDLYTSAHLIVSAIRILENQKAVPPSVDDVCGMLSISLERGNFLCKKLGELGIIDFVAGAYGTKLFIKNHLEIENIPKDKKESELEKELKKFKHAKKDQSKKIESMKMEQAEKKKNLFAELEDKLKKSLDKK
jgi:hypothetical protein